MIGQSRVAPTASLVDGRGQADRSDSMGYFNQGNGRRKGGVEGWRRDVVRGRGGGAGSESKGRTLTEDSGGWADMGEWGGADRWLTNQ